jgi:hypothetical protein
MASLGWPRPPLILGLVLGGLAERNLFLSYARYEFEWLTRPVVLILIGVCLLVVFYPTLERRFRRTTLASLPAALELLPEETPEFVRGAKTTLRSRLNFNLLFTVGLLVLGIIGIIGGADLGEQARLMPWVLAFPLVGLTAIYLVLLLGGWVGESRGQMDLGIENVDPTTVRSRTVIMLSWLLGSLAGVWLFGFVFAGPILTLFYLKVVGKEKWLISIALAVMLGLSFWVFRDYLYLRLYPGVVPLLFGMD